ncbi:MAG: STAS domain-containing protein [Actinomycetota bacterium]|nr:STAS domain-containing protein [Actinomycetota bacterium]
MRVATAEPSSPPLAATQVLDLRTLTVRSRRGGDVHVLALSGELDLSGAPVVEEELRSVAADAIIIDLRGLTFIDSTGLRLLVETSRRTEACGQHLLLLPPVDRVFRVFEISGLDRLLPFEAAPLELDA